MEQFALLLARHFTTYYQQVIKGSDLDLENLYLFVQVNALIKLLKLSYNSVSGFH
jgi:hypothetical protein